MAGKITDYPTMTTLASGDLMDVSDSDGVGGFTSKSLDWDDLKTNIESQITFTNLYTNNGNLAGNRIVTLNGNDLTFAGTVDANLLRLDPTTDFIGIGTILPSAKLEVVGNTFVNNGKLTVSNAFNTSTGAIEATAQATSGSSGFTSAGKFNSLITTSGFSANNVGVLATAVGGTSETFAAKFQVNSGAVDTPTYGTYGVFSRNNATTTTPNYAGYFKSENVNGSSNHAIYGFASGAGTKNIAGLFNATGATNNYAIIVPSGGGNVGIGTATPTETLEVAGNGYINGRLGVNAAPFGNAASYLISISGDLYGKRIIADNLAANGFGLYVRSTSPTNNFGIYGKSTTTGSGSESSGVEGISDGTNGTNHYGVRGRGKNGSSLSFGGYFQIEGGASVVAANRTSAVYGLNQSTNSGQNIAVQGLSLSTSGISYGLKAEATGAATTNYGGYFKATTATNNYAIIVPSGGGNVGIGTTTPDANAKLDVDGVIKTKSYVVASLPTVVVGGIIYVSDETGGAVLAFSDGVDWRRVTDRAIVS